MMRSFGPLTLWIAIVSSIATAQTKPDKDYLVYVVSESADKIALIRFGPNGARVDHQVDTGNEHRMRFEPGGAQHAGEHQSDFRAVAAPRLKSFVEISTVSAVTVGQLHRRAHVIVNGAQLLFRIA